MAIDRTLVARLYERSHAERWGLSLEQFQEAIETSVARGFRGSEPSARAAAEFASGLHLEDLALAAACAAGHEDAWNYFVLEHRPALYRAADAIDPTGGARELADSLYADLFGLKSDDGVRQSLFRYFHGRSRLITWLRAVLSQRHVDVLRASRRFDALPDDVDAPATSAHPDAANADRPRWLSAMQSALASAVGDLPSRDRLRLSCYYVQNLTLAQIGRLLREHEATVSRHLSRTRRAIRTAVEQSLKEQHGLDHAAVMECFESVAMDAGPIDMREILTTSDSLSDGDPVPSEVPSLQAQGPGKIDSEDRSK